MNKEFISYEQALALKELGFNEECLCYFNTSNKNLLLDLNNRTDNNDERWVSALLYQQAFRWFREKYNINGEITWDPSYEYDPGKWSDAIYSITIVDISYTKEWKAESPNMQRGKGRQLTYEDAQSACIDKLIEIVKNKENEYKI